MTFTLLILAAAALYFMTAEERSRLVRGAVALVDRLGDAAMRVRTQHSPRRSDAGPALPRPVATLALAAMTIAAFVALIVDVGDLANPDKLLRWGGNFGPRTTNGEWWRLASASFVHAGPLALLINLAALVQVGLVLERAVGRSTLLAVFLGSGILASLVSVSIQPVAVTVGASGAIFGLYGLLLSSWMWGLIRGCTAIRLPVILKLAPIAAIFIFYNVFAQDLRGPAETASLVTGFLSGLLLAESIHVSQPPARRVASTLAATMIVAVASAVPLRGLSDIRPLIANLVEVEGRTAAAYDAGIEQFRAGRTTARALADLIERRIIPDLHRAGEPLTILRGIPEEHQPLSRAAQDYLRLRDESWRLRLNGLRTSSMPKLREADKAENRAMELFRIVVDCRLTD